MNRSTLSAAEAALVWAAATFGATDSTFERLEVASRHPCKRCHDEAVALGEEEREEVLARWSEQDRFFEEPQGATSGIPRQRQQQHFEALDGRWKRLAHEVLQPEGGALGQRDERLRRVVLKLALLPMSATEPRLRRDLVAEDPAEHYDTAQLCQMPLNDLERFCRRLGAHQLAEVWRKLDRRQLVRALRGVQDPELRQWLTEDLRSDREVDGAEYKRIQEAFMALSKRYTELRTLTLYLGLYFIAVAGGRRHEDRLELLARRLPDAFSGSLRSYMSLNRRSSRRGLEGPVARDIKALRDAFMLPPEPEPEPEQASSPSEDPSSQGDDA